MERIKYIFKIGLTFISIVLIGLALMIITYALPNTRVRSNLANSIAVLEEEGAYKNLINGYIGTRLDNYTDAIILSELFYDNDNYSVIEKTMRNFGNYSGNNPCQSLIDEINQNSNIETSAYERYWHGNLVILKPLFMIFDYSSIRILNGLMQMLLIFVLVWLMIKNNLGKYIFPLGITLFLINPITISLSLQFSSMFYITIISLIILLTFKDIIFEKKLLPFYFMIIGMLSSYFDLLTFPIISLGIPIIFVILLNKNITLLKSIKYIFIYSILWGIGYGGMWISKWILGSIILKENLFIDAINNIKFRTSVDNYNRLDAIKNNFSIYGSKIYYVIFACIAIYYSTKMIRNIKYFEITSIKKIIPFVIISLMPIVWYICLSNHSYIHFWFTYRSLAVLFFALLAGLEILTDYKFRDNRE